ncbi:MAG: hypothetical protein A2504_09160 [Bdellovibrionales bacterium RIFOXYD12_FULL_39_22]|nr:MAG: hypothetical protein A2385_17390 [Bdellovibrionales bacterium RIFOXYB1_FULL_39_21]OFZ41090.1 MAG: hypothetical protein A2485_00315 [Bdellovibrionales bacterium RIFOXYC12_FULL_39_17]OFZ50303.1 MAG: hypothetical protein A2404_07630 [Bdellovibrionales bacterium RIFOXYC1_FULL_39_130]OFZ72058.1 MAG: hypothetical protein A2451_05585 [Bdellovibrionales bacterium RIFOXYC2_FULL_39_8]OFZ75104.1 MAG: hypothetical protein A2560_16325 [Bdellovibrionales bacterium RIFOXYD1_FULL_39_84]OFZ92254.1 MAG:
MKNRLALLLLATFIFYRPLLYATDWIAKAHIFVPTAGLVETILPPNLHKIFPDNSESLDGTLIAPSGDQVDIYSYFIGNAEEKELILEASATAPNESGKVAITYDIPDNFLSYRFSLLNNGAAELDSPGIMAEAIFHGNWIPISLNQKVTSAFYKKIRLTFPSSTTNGMEKKLSATGNYEGEDFSTTMISLPLSGDNGEIGNTMAIFPGSGLIIEKLIVGLSEKFAGQWYLPQFALSGNADGDQFEIPLDKILNFTTLIIKLRATDERPYEITSIQAKCKLKKIAFLAQTGGDYIFTVGSGQQIKSSPLPVSATDNQNLPIKQILGLTDIIKNPALDNDKKTASGYSKLVIYLIVTFFVIMVGTLLARFFWAMKK